MPGKEMLERVDNVVATIPWPELPEDHMPLLRRYLLHGFRDAGFYGLVLTEHPELIPSGVNLEDMLFAASFHDSGKPFVTGGDSTLWDRQTLNDLDRLKIRMHPVASEEILERAKGRGCEIPYVAFEIARYHHVRRNGTGYPRRPEGFELPAYVEVFGIVDYIVALCESHDVRPYRERGMTLAEAHGVLSDSAGQGVFDKQYVEMVFDILRSNNHLNGGACSWLGPYVDGQER